MKRKPKVQPRRKPKTLPLQTIDVVIVKTYRRGPYMYMVMRGDDGTIYKEKFSMQPLERGSDPYGRIR